MLTYTIFVILTYMQTSDPFNIINIFTVDNLIVKIVIMHFLFD